MGSPQPLVVQINWQDRLGGGEVYTRFFSRALVESGLETRLMVSSRAAFWRDLDMPADQLVPIAEGVDIARQLPDVPCVVVSHNALSPQVARGIAGRCRLIGIVHMPFAERSAAGLACYHRLIPVSAHVRDTLRAHGLDQVWEEPLLGVADLGSRASGNVLLRRRSPYDWDRRKFRERLLSWLEPLVPRSGAPFVRRPGLTLGVFSRLTPIKQFPQLLSHLAPVLARFPQVNLEIFGSGGFASVRDMKKALAPIRERTRFWGFQPDPMAVYSQLDYLLSGLPEKEALGLNIIEAQAAGTPVFAVDAPPFTETVIHGVTGFLYRDPRRDGGADFNDLLGRLSRGAERPDPARAADHLAKFSPDAFRARVGRALASELAAGAL